MIQTYEFLYTEINLKLIIKTVCINYNSNLVLFSGSVASTAMSVMRLASRTQSTGVCLSSKGLPEWRILKLFSRLPRRV